MEINLREFEGEVVVLGGSGIRKKPHRTAYKPTKTNSPVQAVRVERARYAKLEDGFRKYLQRMIDGYIGGTVSRETVIKTFSEDLHKFQTIVYDLGRRTAGNTQGQFTEAEDKYLHGQHSMEMKYFHNFIRDVDAGRGRMKYKIRMDLYGLSGWSVYLRGFLGSFPAAKMCRFHWRRNPEAESCDDCIAREALSRKRGGFTFTELMKIGLPGERTKCGNRCCCSVDPQPFGFPVTRTRSVKYSHINKQDNNAKQPEQTTDRSERHSQ